MNWNEGFTAKYYYAAVDPSSWRDVDTYNLVGGSISKTTDGMMESADLDIRELAFEGEAWVRIYLNATQGASGTREALFTGLMQAPETDWDGTRESHTAELYSVLKPAADVLMPKGWYAPSGSIGAKLAAELLGIGAAPVSYEDNSPTLTSAIIAESKESNLTMARKIVDAIGWRIRISGDGRINIQPKGTEISASIDAMNNDIMELSVTDKRDWYSCPNVFRAVCKDMTAVARDDDPDSPYSTVSRGREIWMEDSSASLNSGESPADYALRRLKEEQSPVRTIDYNRRYVPNVYPGDLVEINHPAQRIIGTFRVTSQNISLGYGARTEETGENTWKT